MDNNNQYVKSSINALRNYAKERGFKIVWRNAPTNCGDFCIFIYRPKFNEHNTRYLVGYDGDWNTNPLDKRSFDNCWEAALNFMRNYKID